MHFVQVGIALVVVRVGLHLVWLALEAHAHIATATCHSVAPVDPHHWYLAGFVGALPYSIFLHVLLEELVSSRFGLLAGQPRVIPQLSNKGGTLQLMQKVERQTSHSIDSFLIILICLHPALKQKVIISAF